MKSTMRAWLVTVATVGAWAAGCNGPTEIVPVAPPGLEFQRVPPVQGEGAQALGEQVTSAPAKKVPAKAADSPPTPIGKPTTTASGLTYETLKEGAGEPAKSGQKVSLHYTGKLTDGTEFDSSLKDNKPLSLTLGMGEVIQGWDEGIAGMKVGERRKLTIPPTLGYGPRAQGPIPPNSTLVFEVELLEAKD